MLCRSPAYHWTRRRLSLNYKPKTPHKHSRYNRHVQVLHNLLSVSPLPSIIRECSRCTWLLLWLQYSCNIMTKQLTLFGSFARSDSADKKSYIYKNPVGRYQCFIERYYQRNQKSDCDRSPSTLENLRWCSKEKFWDSLAGEKLFKCDKSLKSEEPNEFR